MGNGTLPVSRPKTLKYRVRGRVFSPGYGRAGAGWRYGRRARRPTSATQVLEIGLHDRWTPLAALCLQSAGRDAPRRRCAALNMVGAFIKVSNSPVSGFSMPSVSIERTVWLSERLPEEASARMRSPGSLQTCKLLNSTIRLFPSLGSGPKSSSSQAIRQSSGQKKRKENTYLYKDNRPAGPLLPKLWAIISRRNSGQLPARLGAA